MIFVDTGAWFAAFVPNELDHEAARGWLDGNTESLLTSDYVLDETLTLFRVRGEQSRAYILGEQILSESITTLHLVTMQEIHLAFEIFREFAQAMELHRLREPGHHGSTENRNGICLRRSFPPIRHGDGCACLMSSEHITPSSRSAQIRLFLLKRNGYKYRYGEPSGVSRRVKESTDDYLFTWDGKHQ